jgi:4-hydroxy-tetrahydrodipicolinate reductase
MPAKLTPLIIYKEGPTMPINILINGANGKMGHTTVTAIANEPDLKLVATTTRDDDLAKAIRENNVDVVIDFTIPSAVFDNTKKIIDSGARPVIGTTGLTTEQINELSQLCKSKKIGCIIAPNFSVGAILLMRYAQDAAKYFPDVEIIEYHHPKKLDAPSGTAKKTAELIAKNKSQPNTSAPIDADLKNNASRGLSYCGVPIHAVRSSGIFADEAVIFGNHSETFTLRHHASDRNAMMPGVFLCCRKVMEINELVFGMENVL